MGVSLRLRVVHHFSPPYQCLGQRGVVAESIIPDLLSSCLLRNAGCAQQGGNKAKKAIAGWLGQAGWLGCAIVASSEDGDLVVDAQLRGQFHGCAGASSATTGPTSCRTPVCEASSSSAQGPTSVGQQGGKRQLADDETTYVRRH